MATRGHKPMNSRRRAGRCLPPVLIALVILLAWYAGEAGSMLPRSFPAVGDSSQMATVNTDLLNVRSGPSISEPVVAIASDGDQLAVTGPEVAGFVPVRTGATTGWMAADYLSLDEEEGPTGGEALAVAMAAGNDQEAPLPTAAPTVAATEESPDVNQQEAAPAAEPTVNAERWIKVDRSAATVTLYIGDRVAGVFGARIGRDPSPDGFYATAIGSYRVYDKHKGLSPTPFAEDTYLTDWVGFDPERSNGFHSPVRNQDGTVREWQNPTTLGCVRLDVEDAESVFAFAEIGMRVEVVE